MKVTVWIKNRAQITAISALIGKPLQELEEAYLQAWRSDRLCVFDVDVTAEQYKHIQTWHLDNQINETYVRQERNKHAPILKNEG